MDLFSDDNLILLNPRWPQEEYTSLQELAEWAQAKMNLRGHVWISTSGSTATSVASNKMVALSKDALRASAKSVNEHLQATAQDVWTQVLPSFHVGGLGIEVRASLSKSRVVPALFEGRWDVDHFYQTLLTEGCTLSALVPTQIYDLVLKKYSAPKTLRAVVIGGGALSEDLYLRARELGWPVLPSYGMTETASQIATASLQSLDERVYPEMQLLSHAQVRTNAQGFLEVHALSLMTCYAQCRSGEAAQVWDPKNTGWFTTEDQGQVRGRSVEVSGRTQDYVKIGGEATNLQRLRLIFEGCLEEVDKSFTHKAVILDMPSDRLGAEIHLATVLDEKTLGSVLEMYSKKVLPFEKIRKVHEVSEIPRSDLGKVLWGQLRSKL